MILVAAVLFVMAGLLGWLVVLGRQVVELLVYLADQDDEVYHDDIELPDLDD